MHTVGFEPTKHIARDLESRPFDRSGMCTYNLFSYSQRGLNPRPLVHKTNALTY